MRSIHPVVEVRVGSLWVALSTYDKENHTLESEDIPVLYSNIFANGILTGKLNGFPTGNVPTPRGLPLDASQDVLSFWEHEYTGDYHTPSWLTVAEIAEVNWYAPVWEIERCLKWVPRYYNRFGKFPFCAKYFLKLLKTGNDDLVEFRYQIPFTALCGSFTETFLPWLLKLEWPHEDIRVVFWFDN